MIRNGCTPGTVDRMKTDMVRPRKPGEVMDERSNPIVMIPGEEKEESLKPRRATWRLQTM
jgi:hypothetical protein